MYGVCRAPPPLAALALLALVHVAASAADVASPAHSGREKRAFGFHNGFFITKGRETIGITGGAKSMKGHSLTFEGGCVSRPKNPTRTTMQCHSYSGCRLACLRDHVFPNGAKRLMVICEGGKWHVQGTNWETIPDCMPECHPPCQNSGICIKPNVCNCSESYIGPQCQYNRQPCLNDSPLPANSLKKCNSKTCSITCIEGHKFPDGSSITNLVCQYGTWRPSRKEWSTIPDCKPTCHPPCENGGNCLSFNTCQCPQDFKGPQCQYEKEVCRPQKLNFNGQYKCVGDNNALTCHLHCPGGRFETTPAANYTCEYAVGIFLPSPTPQCVYDTMVGVVPTHFFTVESGRRTQTNWSAIFNKIPIDVSDMFHTTTLVKTAVPGTCYAWGDHYKTFDGQVLSFQGNCSYTLVHDAVDSTFSINLEAHANGSRPIKVFAQDKEYTLSLNERRLPVLKVGSRIFNIPTQLPGVTVKYSAHFVEFSVTLAGFSLIWDTQSSVTIDIKEHLWNRTVGLCGRIDGYPENDFQMKDGKIATRVIPFANSWQVEKLGETCSSPAEETNPCDSPSARDGTADEAAEFCNKLLTDPHFAVCRTFVDVQPYYDACRWDYCTCRNPSGRNGSHDCACKSIAMFVKQCSIHDVSVLNWRDTTMCPMECDGGRIYMSCNPENQPTCGSEEEVAPTNLKDKRTSSHCIEGCYCPPRTVLHDQKCITRDLCPCQLRGRSFPPGHTMPKDCNTCTCDNGRWACTQTRCSARCSAIGDPHYATFDGKRYDFMGKCSYYLVKGENYSVEAENVACSGAVSKNIGFIKMEGDESPSCTKSVTIKVANNKIQLKQGREVFVNGIQVISLPTEIAGVLIHPVSSLFIIVRLPNKLTVWWDGTSSVYIDAPPALHGKTKGLCGTFTMNQKDDFVTPEEDVEQSVIAFANKWKTDERCADETETERPQPCDINPHKKETANKYCSRIRGALFERCHWVVDPEPYYHNCMYDMCSCEQKVSQCLCPIIAAYAKECIRKGVHIDWRGSVRECGIHCPNGQQYQQCGSTCTRSCRSIALAPRCDSQCVEGCNCPEGQTLNDVTGECIPISNCPCQFNGLEFRPNQKEVRFSPKGSQLCTCSNAKWDCRPATFEEIRLYSDIGTIKYNCSVRNNEQYTACLPSTTLTCKNMHNQLKASSPSICKTGCTCKKGFVLDSDTNRCIRPNECPCHHGGRSYSNGSTIQEECNICICKNGKWNCTERVCAGVCSAWGDSHYKTFDSRIFDFHGTCDYLLAKGVITNDETFDVSIQNVECGSIGASCSKSLTLKVGTGSRQEVITFTRDKQLPIITGLDRIQIRIAGLFVFAEVTDLGVVVQWDQGTRVYIKVAPKWKNKIKGLCGNYNDNMLDDFQTPSGGLAEVSANLFGDSWRLQTYCPESMNITDTCVHHPNRKLWAMQKCGILKSSIFLPCHSEVPIEPYLERCIFDSCACDMGGDCECLCTALAAYAHECNAHGVHIRWRSQNLCPMQCDEKCSRYSPCIDTCPKTTCENQFIIGSLTHLCKEDTCVEGCELKPCPPGEVYYNKTALECVPKASCKTVCMEVGGVTYYEGDIMEQDECHSCFCSRHKKSCRGTICTTTTPAPNHAPLPCRSGWTSWINNYHRDRNKSEINEREPIPSETFLNNMLNNTARCNLNQIKSIECRIVNSLKSHKNTSLNVSCNTDEGLICYGSKCPDFEIRLLCDCGVSTTPIYTSELTTPRTLCDADKPNKPHEVNCHLFYQCVDTVNERKFVEKSCGRDMMYNKDTQVCDHPFIVIAKWPECASSTETTLISSTEAPKTPGTTFPAAGSTETTLISSTESPKTPGTTFPAAVSTETILISSTEAPKTPGTTFPAAVTAVPTVASTTEIGSRTTVDGCKIGDVWKSCGIPCHKVCLYYHFILTTKGFCTSSEDCVAGCVREELSGGCPAGYLWRDKDTCVSVADCMCYSHSGQPVKPGEVIHESDCKICQCLNNHYVCDISLCETTPATVIPETEATVATPSNGSHIVVTVPSTTTPPSPCEDDKFVPLVEGASPLPNVAFLASSDGVNPGQQSYFARILKTPKNEYAWTPAKQNKNQFLQINLGSIQPIYGVAMQGGTSGYVTSYTVLFSPRGDLYEYVKEGKNIKKFRGPVDKKQPMIQMFKKPVEAQYIRFNPETWHDAISMRIEIYGCGELTTPFTVEPTEEYITAPTTETIIISTTLYSTPSVECSDEMGLNNGMMNDQQITVSSVKENNLNKFGPSQLLLSARVNESEEKGGAWMPDLNDVEQWIQFDFLEPRNLTGFISKGSENSNDWVETFKVLYSHDSDSWNSIIEADGTEKIFPGNYDGTSSHQNNFPRVLRTRYLRLVPSKWHANIAVRAEVIGCFEPYPVVTTAATTLTTPSSKCQVCVGVPPEKMQGDKCLLCNSNLWWNGETCVNRTLCPCFVNHVRYDVGKVYETEDCKECVCKLNGVQECKKKECRNKCEPGLLRVLTPVCGCTCKPCPIGTVLCPTSNICINESFWCNGVQDCPDDERSCPETSPTPISPPTTKCPSVTCPPGTKLVIAHASEARYSKGKGLKGAMNLVNKKGVKGERLQLDTKTNQRPQGEDCNVMCVPILQPTTRRPTNCTNIKPICNPPYVLFRVPTKTDDNCPIYTCAPPRAICNITHNSIDTFDGMEFKHEICNHIVSTGIGEMKWNISMMKNCSSDKSCSRYLKIIQDEYTLILYPDMGVDLDGVHYTSHEAKYLSGKYNSFAVFHVGDSLLFQSHHYGFWIIWDRTQNAKLGVTEKLYNSVRGLCGTFNGNLDDDRTTPSENIVKSNIEFAKSWAIPGALECEATKCPLHLQIQAQEICNSVKANSFSSCHSVVEIDRFISRCMESTCSCLSNAKGKEACHCSALLEFVTTCQSADASVDLTGWRTQHGCSVQCPPSFVYHDCYRHKCEPSCSGTNIMGLCDTMPGTCFSGCFCPDGLLRQNDRCISPNECRDCVCDSFGDPQYMTFDRSNFTFNGNCTYVASQDYNRTYQVLVTNHQCHGEPTSTCTQAVEVRYLNHSVTTKFEERKIRNLKLITSIDGKIVTRFPHKEGSWLHLDRVENSEISILVLPIQLEVKYVFHNYAFMIRLPSSVFKNKTEGLCGNCNRIKADDFKMSNGTLSKNTDEFGLSWLHHQPDEELCKITSPSLGCKLLPPNEDPCLQLRDAPIFRKCRNILDPEPYIAACQYDLCHSSNTSDAACKDMEAYVTDCERNGICLEWRSPDLCPFKCPEGRLHQSCQLGCSRTCENILDASFNCSSLVSDGCYCPEGQVLNGDECVNISKCLPCDSEGHFDGDSWQEDKCTNCTCVGTRKVCKQQICLNVKTICKEGMVAVEETTSHEECCKKVTCVPGPPPLTTCPPPKIPLCRDDQNATSVVGGDGCDMIVCKCKPCKSKVRFMVDEGEGTDELNEDEEIPDLDTGERLETDNSGCCSKWIKKCYPEDCPTQKCRAPLIPRNITAVKPKCCPNYDCVPPPRTCLLQENNASTIITKEVGVVWHNGPCQKCECKEISGIPESVCNKMICPAADMNPEVTENYVLESTTLPGECCPSVKRTACKVNDTILEPGKNITQYYTDHCISHFCKLTVSGTIERVTEAERCNTNCKVGWKYINPNSKPKKCCGECRPSGCVHNGILYAQGKKWKSADTCTEYFCLLINGTAQIDSVSVNCPKLPREMQHHYAINEKQEFGKCCKVPVFLGCKQNGTVYEEGENWTSSQDPCKRISCDRLPNGHLTKKEFFETCSTNCSQGWKYEPAASGSGICCGQCVQTACEYEGRIYAPNSTWNSLDGCVNYTCEVTATGKYQVRSESEQCPSVSHCAKDKIYQDKCCKKCKIDISKHTRECEAVSVLTNPRALVKEVKGIHGQCVNTKIDGFTECQGTCFSKTTYSTDQDNYIKSCNCCQPARYIPLSIAMQCTDGHIYNKTINVPSTCTCLECNELTPIKKWRPVY